MQTTSSHATLEEDLGVSHHSTIHANAHVQVILGKIAVVSADMLGNPSIRESLEPSHAH